VIKSERYLGFDDRPLMIIGIPIFTLLVTILIFGKTVFTENPITSLAISFSHVITYWLGFRLVMINYHKTYPDYEFDVRRLFYVISRMTIVYLIIHFTVGYFVHIAFKHHAELHKAHSLETNVASILMIALAFFVYEGIYYFLRSKKTEIEKNKLEKITAEQRLDTLKNQVNPHFLFNSLNTVITMIPEEPELAINFIQKLSKTYRNILEVRNEKLITIRQELKALDAYIFLLKTRFHGKIQIYNTVPQVNFDDFILPLSLQILIENAVKHNITSSSNPLKIYLSVEDDLIIIKNNLQKKSQEYNSTKMGLANIRSRYKLLVNKNIIVKESQEFFTVKLPIIKNSTE